MATDVRITFEDGGLAARLLAADRIFAGEAEDAVRRASAEGAARAKRVIRQHGRVDLRTLLDSVTAEPVRRSGGGLVGGWVATAAHAAVNEEGRRPGARMPPAGALLPWMARHGIPARAEFAIRRAIGRRGIPGIFFMRTAREAVAPRFRRELQAAVRRACARLGGRG